MWEGSQFLKKQTSADCFKNFIHFVTRVLIEYKDEVPTVLLFYLYNKTKVQ